MRRNQVSIKVERFGDQASNGKHQIIEVYADSNNILEALTDAFSEVSRKIIDTSSGHLSDYDTEVN